MEKSFNIMGIDPGSRNIGVAIFTITPIQLEYSVGFEIENVLTFNIAIDEEDSRGIHEALIDRTARLESIMKSLYSIYEPAIVGMESSFINISRMSAVIPLSRAIHSIESAIYSIDRYAKILSMPPGVIKKIFGSKQVGKDAVMVALKNKPQLAEKLNMKRVTDHEVDGVAIAYTLLEYIKTNGGMSCIKYLEI